MKGQDRTDLTDIRWQPAKNVYAQFIPPFALVRFTGMTEDGLIEVSQPNINDEADGVNGPMGIPPQGVGSVSEDFSNWARYECDPASSGSGSSGASGGGASTSGLDTESPGVGPRTSGNSSGGGNSCVPLNGEIWGPKAGSWSLHKSRFGFRIIGGATGGSGSGSGSGGSGNSSGGGARSELRVYVTRRWASGGGARQRIELPTGICIVAGPAPSSGGSGGPIE